LIALNVDDNRVGGEIQRFTASAILFRAGAMCGGGHYRVGRRNFSQR